MYDDTFARRRRALFIILILALFLIIFVPWLLHYLNTGKIIITTENKYSDITVSSLSKNVSGKGFSINGQDSLTTKLKAGSYFVSVEQSSSARTQYVTIKGRQTLHLNMPIPGTLGVEPVTYDDAQDIAADGSHLTYLNPVDYTINQVDSHNNDIETGDTYELASISWATSTYGIGQNSKGQLFVVNNGSVSPLKSPLSDQGSGVVYSVAPNKDIYIAYDSAVYVGTDHSGFKMIYNQRITDSVLLAGSDRVAIVSSGYSNVKPNITVVSSDGRHVVNKDLNNILNTWSGWSQHDKYLFVQVGAKTEILNDSLQAVATVPQNNPTNPVWDGDDTVFYSTGGQLWSYSLKQQGDYLVANMPLDQSIQEMDMSFDKAYVYIVTSDPSNNLSIRRVGLRGQKPPSVIYQLQDILPTNGDGYSLNLMNFSGRPMIMVGALDLENPQTALQLAKQFLVSRGFNISQFSFSVVDED